MPNFIDRVRDKIKAYQKERHYKKWCKKDNWYGLIPGDVVEYKGQEYMYMGINRHGGPGMPGIPEPIFWSTDPAVETVFYVRRTGEYFPENIFGEKNPPITAGGVESITRYDVDMEKRKIERKETITTPESGRNLGSIGFLNPGMSSMVKKRHISPQEWNSMVNNVKAELGGQTVQ